MLNSLADVAAHQGRPGILQVDTGMARLGVPPEEWGRLAGVQPALLMKQTIPTAALSVMPNCGHTINIEDPDQFNRLVGEFVVQVDCGRWPVRDPRAMVASITGMK